MDLNLTGCDENEDATQQFAEWCSQLGFDGRLADNGKVFTLRSKFKWNCEVKANARSNHRLVLTTIYSAKKSGPSTRSDWVNFMNSLNVSQNMFKFAFDDDGDMTVQVYLVFLEKLPPRALRNFLNSIDDYLGH